MHTRYGFENQAKTIDCVSSAAAEGAEVGNPQPLMRPGLAIVVARNASDSMRTTADGAHEAAIWSTMSR
jgi:hypothetical protein